MVCLDFIQNGRSAEIKYLEEGVIVKDVYESAIQIGSVQLPKGQRSLRTR